MATRQRLADWLADARRDEGVTAELASVIESLAAACVALGERLRTAALEGYAGALETTNIHGETQKALDVLANTLFMEHLTANPAIGLLASEEEDEVVDLGRSGAAYGVSFDPLDGSTNADVNMTIGSIFSVHRLDPHHRSLLRKGREQVAAGFAAYGPATSLVLTFGKTAALFQYAPDAGSFLLLDAKLSVPVHAREYAINASRAPHWDEVVGEYVAHRVAGQKGPLGKAFNMRWTGSMVADIQRILRRGGIFLYPVDAETRHLGGRLRLLYEAAPIALIIEAAGGRATTGHEDLLDVVPHHLHQKVPVVLGSAEDVDHLVEAYRRYSAT